MFEGMYTGKKRSYFKFDKQQAQRDKVQQNISKICRCKETENNPFKLQVNGRTRSCRGLEGEMICFCFNFV